MSVERSVLITGASGGIGRATVEHLASRGWTVFAGMRKPEPAASWPETVIPVELDVTDDASIARAVEFTAANSPPSGLSGLVNLAGFSADGAIETLARSSWQDQFEVNVFGACSLARLALPLLRQSHGRIVNVGGVAGRLALPMYGGLSASKAALDAATTSMRMELRQQGVSVLYIEPGAIRTDFFAVAARRANSHAADIDGQTRAIYAKAADVSREALAKSRMSPPESVVRAIDKALTSRRPKARYIVGLEANMALRFLVHLPAPLREFVIMRSMGLEADMFPSSAASN